MATTEKRGAGKRDTVKNPAGTFYTTRSTSGQFKEMAEREGPLSGDRSPHQGEDDGQVWVRLTRSRDLLGLRDKSDEAETAHRTTRWSGHPSAVSFSRMPQFRSARTTPRVLPPGVSRPL